MGNLLILAAGMSSRMKKQTELNDLDAQLTAQANAMPKGMIGVGRNGRPFLDYQIYNAAKGGFKNIVILINPKDTVTKPYYEKLVVENKAWGLTIQFAIQTIPANREKPLGTADAVKQALEQHPEWTGQRFTACNADNLYSANVFNLMLNAPKPEALISYDSVGLGFDYDKVKNCAALVTDSENYLEEIIEKPTDEEITRIEKQTGRLGISMNIFSFQYETAWHYMEIQPLHTTRNEKEMPSAMGVIAKENPKTVIAIPVNEFMPDMTSKADLNLVKTYLEENFSEL